MIPEFLEVLAEALGAGCDVFRPLSDVLLCGHRCADAGMLRSTAAPSPGPGEGGRELLWDQSFH